MTISWDEYFIQVANLISKRSSCLVKQFGAVITKNNRIVSTGYNGTPSQFLNCNQGGCERCRDRIEGKIKTGEQLEKCLCIHAEASAILQNSKECQGSTLYITGEPCIQCAKLILSVGIERVVCLEGQYLNNGVFLLNTKNREGKNVVVERHKCIWACMSFYHHIKVYTLKPSQNGLVHHYTGGINNTTTCCSLSVCLKVLYLYSHMSFIGV